MAELKIGAPPFPNRNEHPFVATVRYRKLVIDIENLDGSIREGKDPNGKPWKTEFHGAHYGEIRNSKGTDGDALDVYIKNPPDDKASNAYIIHQNHPRTHPSKGGQYDEDKVVLGVSSADEAKELYLRHYNRKDFLRSITEMALEPFKRYIFGENKAEKVANAATAFIRMKLRGDSFAKGKKMKTKIATVSDAYKLGYEMGMAAKLAEGAVGTAATVASPAATQPVASLSSSMRQSMPPRPAPPPNAAAGVPAGAGVPGFVPKDQFPQHGGPVTPIADLKAQMDRRANPPLKQNLTSS